MSSPSRTTTPLPNKPPNEALAALHPDDIACARGGHVKQHPGNKRFREIIRLHIPEYNRNNIRKKGKTEIVTRILHQCRSRGGNFQRYDHPSKSWQVESEVFCREKIGFALRDGLPEQYSSSTGGKILVALGRFPHKKDKSAAAGVVVGTSKAASKQVKHEKPQGEEDRVHQVVVTPSWVQHPQPSRRMPHTHAPALSAPSFLLPGGAYNNLALPSSRTKDGFNNSHNLLLCPPPPNHVGYELVLLPVLLPHAHPSSLVVEQPQPQPSRPFIFHNNNHHASTTRTPSFSQSMNASIHSMPFLSNHTTGGGGTVDNHHHHPQQPQLSMLSYHHPSPFGSAVVGPSRIQQQQQQQQLQQYHLNAGSHQSRKYYYE